MPRVHLQMEIWLQTLSTIPGSVFMYSCVPPVFLKGDYPFTSPSWERTGGGSLLVTPSILRKLVNIWGGLQVGADIFIIGHIALPPKVLGRDGKCKRQYLLKNAWPFKFPVFTFWSLWKDGYLLCQQVPETGCRMARILLTRSRGAHRKVVNVDVVGDAQLRVR